MKNARKDDQPGLKRVLTQRIVMGEVLVPGVPDAEGDVVSSEVVKQAAYQFLVYYRTVGRQHQEFDNVGEVVESFIARPQDPDFTPGAWVIAVQCSEETWKRVCSGELKGFSIGGVARRQ